MFLAVQYIFIHKARLKNDENGNKLLKLEQMAVMGKKSSSVSVIILQSFLRIKIAFSMVF